MTIRHSSSRRRGFTLVELMTTVTVAGVLVVGGAPSFNSVILNQGVKTTSFELVSALTYTRSEAIKRNRRVTLRAVDDDWRHDWFICAAPDPTVAGQEQGRCHTNEVELKLRDWTHPNSPTITATTTVATVVTGSAGSTTTYTPTPVTAVTFRADGRVSSWVQFTVCNEHPSAAVTQRLIRLDAGGRPSVKRGDPCGT